VLERLEKELSDERKDEVLDLLCGDEELFGNELNEEPGLDDEVNELTELFEELEFVYQGFSILNQLILNPPVKATIPKLWLPAVRVIVRVMLTQFCPPPVEGIETES
jgi:hypothetical protein